MNVALFSLPLFSCSRDKFSFFPAYRTTTIHTRSVEQSSMFKRTGQTMLPTYIWLFVFVLSKAGYVHSLVRPISITRSTTRWSLSTVSNTAFREVNPTILHDDVDHMETSKAFDWFKAWYPLVPVEILDVERPHRFHLMGEDVVVWYDGAIEGGRFGSKLKRPKRSKRSNKGAWRAFADECPHRKVPLSEGRVEDDGTLLCSYHAWRFDGQGQCVAVPQIEASDDRSRILQNPKTRCHSFPTTVSNGILFVWPNSDENAALESALTPVEHGAVVESNQDRFFQGPWNFRELPYGADYFIENVVDPAHVVVSHHNIVGSRYMNQQMIMTKTQPLTRDGFTVLAQQPFGNSTITFAAPSRVTVEAPFGNKGIHQKLELYVSPSRPGFCYHVGRTVILKDSVPKWLHLVVERFLAMKWLNHVIGGFLLTQDSLFLHHQERAMARTKQYTSSLRHGEDACHYTKMVYPINSDMGVILFRTWFRVMAGGGIPYKYNREIPEPSNEVVFDVWNGHTKYCKYCQDTVRRLQQMRLSSFLVATCISVLRPNRLRVVWNLVATLSFVGVGVLIHHLIGMFYRHEYSHAHND